MFKKIATYAAVGAMFALSTGASVAQARTALATATLPVMMTSAAACNDGNNRRVSIVNETGVVMREFYASPPDVSNWEEDILGSDVIAAYGSKTINFDDGRCRCIYDFKAVFSDGDVLTREKVNVCEISTYRYHN